MAKTNIATWTKTREGWRTIVEFRRSWEAPKAGTGKGTEHDAKIVKRGEYESRVPVSRVRLTGRVFERDGRLLAFCEEVK